MRPASILVIKIRSTAPLFLYRSALKPCRRGSPKTEGTTAANSACGGRPAPIRRTGCGQVSVVRSIVGRPGSERGDRASAVDAPDRDLVHVAVRDHRAHALRAAALLPPVHDRAGLD